MFKEIIKEDSKIIIIKDKEILVNIKVEIFHEEEAPDFDYGNEEENRVEMARFESGELLNIGILVHVYFAGMEGIDSLGQCFVTSKNLTKDIEDILAYYDMIENAINSLREQVTTLLEAF